MAHITTCTSCGKCYEEVSEELANAPERECVSCWLARLKRDDAAAYIAAKKRLDRLGMRHDETAATREREPIIDRVVVTDPFGRRATFEPCADPGRPQRVFMEVGAADVGTCSDDDHDWSPYEVLFTSPGLSAEVCARCRRRRITDERDRLPNEAQTCPTMSPQMTDDSDAFADWLGDADSLQEWLASPEARVLIEVPIDPTRWAEAMKNRLSVAWAAGYAAGRRERCGEP